MALPCKGMFYEMVSRFNNQGYGDSNAARRSPCSDMELNAIECIEAYGVHKGSVVCRKLFEDLDECRSSILRSFRTSAMVNQRYLQLFKGERNFKNFYGPKYAYDSYVEGTFMP